MTTKAEKGMSTRLTRGRPAASGARRGGVVGARRERAATGDARAVKVADVQPNPDNPQGRSSVDESLVNSVREVGVIQDLVLVPVEQWLAAHPGRESELSDAPYVVLTGHRRLAAAVQAERDEVPARVREDFDETTLDSVVLHENLHRLALTPVEEARALVAGRTALVVSNRADPQLAATYNGVYNQLYGLTGSAAYTKLAASVGRADITIQNIIGVQAAVFGNHEFDFGTSTLASFIQAEMPRWAEIVRRSGAQPS